MNTANDTLRADAAPFRELRLKRGEDRRLSAGHLWVFSNEVARTIMISAATNIAVYVTVVRFAYPAWGLVAGTCAAFASSLLSAYVVYRFMATGRRAASAPRLARCWSAGRRSGSAGPHRPPRAATQYQARLGYRTGLARLPGVH